jgi:uncharacterized protein YaiI (UPF0178 family)
MKPTIYIDADACPVKAEAEEIAIRHGLSLVLVTNGGIRPSANPLVRLVIVGDGPDMADRHIADHVSSGDIVVTSDIPLAAKILGKGGAAIRPNGDLFTPGNIGSQLATRDLMTDLRAADPFLMAKSPKGGGSFSGRDRSNFRNRLEIEIRKMKLDG